MNTIIYNIRLGVIIAAVMVSLNLAGTAQGPWPAVAPHLAGRGPDGNVPPEPVMPTGETMERSLVVDKDVNISLCVTQGNLRINGWNRNEVRVYVQDGAKFGFKVLEKNRQNSPVWVMITGVEPDKGKSPECIWGEDIEIDVPANAVINLKGQETKVNIDTVRKATVKMIGGDITIHNVSAGVTAFTGQGDVTVEESQGAISLETTTGNILVFEAGPSEIGDIAKVKTNSGLISLQKLRHRQIEAGSISGSIAYNGEILNGGTYSLSTSNGSIRLVLPQTTNCSVSALYGYGSFNSEIPIKIITENIAENSVKIINGLIGKADATLKLTTNNGSIAIKKQ
jgi:hypothetical protein